MARRNRIYLLASCAMAAGMTWGCSRDPETARKGLSAPNEQRQDHEQGPMSPSDFRLEEKRESLNSEGLKDQLQPSRGGAAQELLSPSPEYRSKVRSFAESNLYTGKSEAEVYADVIETRMHYRCVAFLEMFPRSVHARELQEALGTFRVLEAPATSPLVVSFSELKQKYGFDGVERVYYWAEGLGFMRVGSAGKQIWRGPICVGNLQLLRGGFTHEGDGLKLLPGTRLIYPAPTTSK